MISALMGIAYLAGIASGFLLAELVQRRRDRIRRERAPSRYITGHAVAIDEAARAVGGIE